MKRFTSRRSSAHRFRTMIRFCRKNGQLLFMVLLILCGALFGCSSFARLTSEEQATMSSLFTSNTEVNDVSSGCLAVLSASFGNGVLLILLFLFGLTAFGGPLIFAAEIFFGFCVGISESQAYLQNGMISVLLHVLLPMTVCGVAMVIAGVQAIRLSCVFTKQLLPSGAHCGGMWIPFRNYILRFLICLFFVFVSAVAQVIVLMCM